MDYELFLDRKRHISGGDGFDPLVMPDYLKPFQQYLVEWSLRQGRGALFADCGLGKSIMSLVWAYNVARKTNKPVLILTPLAVANQFVTEGEKFGVECYLSRDGKWPRGKKIIVSNYQKLHYFQPDDFSAVVLDESSILKSFNGQTRKDATRFVSKLQFRLLATATAAPNDYVELGTSSEALGELSHSDMLKRFFAQLDDKGQKREAKLQNQAEELIKQDPSYYRKLAFRVSQTIGQWRIKHHAVDNFWQWVSSWSRACRKPSDMGFDDTGYDLPPLVVRDHVIKPNTPPEGMLFTMPAVGLSEEREERKRTLTQRCEFAAQLVAHNRPAVIWCHMNAEADKLVECIPDAEQVAGRTPDDRKIELYDAFTRGQQRVLVIKPKIGAWGLNWQHCNHVVTFATHSYEQYYQSIRRCYRFGQERQVEVDCIATEGESRVLDNMRHKADKADAMFDLLVKHMNNAIKIERPNDYTNEMEIPQWL